MKRRRERDDEGGATDENGWPVGWVDSFSDMPTGFDRPDQGVDRPVPRLDPEPER